LLSAGFELVESLLADADRLFHLQSQPVSTATMAIVTAITQREEVWLSILLWVSLYGGKSPGQIPDQEAMARIPARSIFKSSSVAVSAGQAFSRFQTASNLPIKVATGLS
jgi:hypothetical protein